MYIYGVLCSSKYVDKIHRLSYDFSFISTQGRLFAYLEKNRS